MDPNEIDVFSAAWSRFAAAALASGLNCESAEPYADQMLEALKVRRLSGFGSATDNPNLERLREEARQKAEERSMQHLPPSE